MFKKLVANLPFSPALVGQLGFYAKRLRQEEATRRLGLLFMVMAVALQSLAVFGPPQQALATSPNDIIAGGVRSKEQLLQTYDQAGDFATLANYLGITRHDLAAINQKTQERCSSDKSLVVFGRQPLFSSAEGEVVYQVPSGGQSLAFYARPLYTFDKQEAVCHEVLAGSSSVAGDFAIIKSSGNIVLSQSQALQAGSQVGGTLNITKSKIARSLTYNTAIASGYTVKASERIEYTLTTTNTSPVTGGPYTITEPLADTLEYATLIDAGGGTLDPATKTLAWPAINLAPGATDQRKVVVEITGKIPGTPYSASNPSSFDCIITNIYGNTLDINVQCPTVKKVESTTQHLPSTGPGQNMLFGSIILGTATYLYARSRQLSREIKLTRHEFSAGAV